MLVGEDLLVIVVVAVMAVVGNRRTTRNTINGILMAQLPLPPSSVPWSKNLNRSLI